ncbi:MAG: hypothetical protein C0508_17435 [Cyanobacteria bacterium PR.023]|jgi:hypothetical protein|nr:hypothetical protein [Cyanobacteria bacterium PR.023]
MTEHQDSSPELLQQVSAQIHEAYERVNPDAEQTWNWSLRVLLSNQQFSSVSHRELPILGKMFL